MSPPNNGGPAFPNLTQWNNNTLEFVDQGMTLRDYFAAKAMQADLTYQGLEGRDDVLHAALMAYEMADAMLKAREKKHD